MAISSCNHPTESSAAQGDDVSLQGNENSETTHSEAPTNEQSELPLNEVESLKEPNQEDNESLEEPAVQEDSGSSEEPGLSAQEHTGELWKKSALPRHDVESASEEPRLSIKEEIVEEPTNEPALPRNDVESASEEPRLSVKEEIVEEHTNEPALPRNDVESASEEPRLSVQEPSKSTCAGIVETMENEVQGANSHADFFQPVERIFEIPSEEQSALPRNAVNFSDKEPIGEHSKATCAGIDSEPNEEDTSHPIVTTKDLRPVSLKGNGDAALHHIEEPSEESDLPQNEVESSKEPLGLASFAHQSRPRAAVLNPSQPKAEVAHPQLPRTPFAHSPQLRAADFGAQQPAPVQPQASSSLAMPPRTYWRSRRSERLPLLAQDHVRVQAPRQPHFWRFFILEGPLGFIFGFISLLGGLIGVSLPEWLLLFFFLYGSYLFFRTLFSLRGREDWLNNRLGLALGAISMMIYIVTRVFNVRGSGLLGIVINIVFPFLCLVHTLFSILQKISREARERRNRRRGI